LLCPKPDRFLMSLLQVIFELIATETAYVRDLQLIVEVSHDIGSLQTKTSSCSSSQVFYSDVIEILDAKDVEIIFSNVEDLLLVNTVSLLVLC
jgi:actin cytoskeleton-regulatory complex protein PAN1